MSLLDRFKKRDADAAVQSAQAKGYVDRTGDRGASDSEFVPAATFAELVSAGDVEGLQRLFSLAGDWDGRETVMVGFKELYRQHHSSDDVRARLRAVLPDILALCKAETSGSSYRHNCLTAAQDLLVDLGGPPAIERPAADSRTDSVIDAVKEWMDQAEVADRDATQDVLHASWGDWGTGSGSEVIDVLERCIPEDFESAPRPPDSPPHVQFHSSVTDMRLGEFDVMDVPDGPSPMQKKIEGCVLFVRAGNSFHYLVRVGPDRFAIRVHGDGIQDLAGMSKEW